MGATDFGRNQQAGGSSTSTDRRSTDGNSSNTATASGTGTGRGLGTGSTGTGTGTEAKEEKLPRVVNVSDTNVTDSEQAKRDAKNARRRERYAQQKAENGGTVKPRKLNKKAPQTAPTPVVDSTQIGVLINTVSGIVASRPNMAHWQLTPKEVDSIATPLSNMIAKSEALAGLAEHSDAIALCTACVTVFAPRMILTAMSVKEEAKKKSTVQNIGQQTGVKNGLNKSDKPDRPDTGQKKQNHDVSVGNRGNTSEHGTDVNTSESWFGASLA